MNALSNEFIAIPRTSLWIQNNNLEGVLITINYISWYL